MGTKNINTVSIIIVVISILFVVIEISDGTANDCKFPAIFNFGDSNSDVRFRPCDGRLIIDFLAEKLGFPKFNAYPLLGEEKVSSKKNTLGADYRNGMSFSIGGSTIMPIFNNTYLAMDTTQLSWFIEFRNQTLELYANSKGDQPNRPKPEDFSKALYTIDIGHNNVAFLGGILNATNFEYDIAIANHLLKLDAFIEKLYALDARSFWIHNVGPLGCLNQKVGPFDQIGCQTRLNGICQIFNKQLKDLVTISLREKHKDASFVYVDIYTVKYNLFKDATKLGFKDRLGVGKGHINWDGIHLSEAANKMVADRIADGSYSDPPVPITGACQPLDSSKTEL